MVPDSMAADSTAWRQTAWWQTGGDDRVRAEPTRRALLAAAGPLALALAGCKGLMALGPLPTPATDVALLDRAISAEGLMVSTYQAALAALAGDATARTAVAEVLAEHQAHLRQLRERLVLPARLARATPGSRRPPPLPAGSHQVLAALAAAERAAVARLTGQLLAAPPALAQLMASISASEAMHVVVLSRPGLTG
jgi:hypothetical protein